MAENKRMLRLSLQFFGGGAEDDGDAYDDFDDDLFDDDEDYGDVDDGEPSSPADATDNGVSKVPPPTSEGEGVEKNADGGARDANDDSQGANGDLIAELRALGYVGNDLAALTADIRQKREAQASQEARAEGSAAKAEGKSHIKSGRPGRSASGDGTGGISERQVMRFVENTGSTKEEARARLAKHARLIEGK